MEMGTHDYLTAQRRDAVLTLPELQALVPMRRMPDGVLMPQRLAERGERGWLADDDRDSTVAARLAALYRQIDQRVLDYRALRGNVHGQRQIAESIMFTWVQIREITGGQW